MILSMPSSFILVPFPALMAVPLGECVDVMEKGYKRSNEK
jgi:hypothetical protein